MLSGIEGDKSSEMNSRPGSYKIYYLLGLPNSSITTSKKVHKKRSKGANIIYSKTLMILCPRGFSFVGPIIYFFFITKYSLAQEI